MQYKENFMVVCDILYWVNIQDIEPLKMINYKNGDEGTPYLYNVVNRSFSALNLKNTTNLLMMHLIIDYKFK